MMKFPLRFVLIALVMVLAIGAQVAADQPDTTEPMKVPVLLTPVLKIDLSSDMTTPHDGLPVLAPGTLEQAQKCKEAAAVGGYVPGCNASYGYWETCSTNCPGDNYMCFCPRQFAFCGCLSTPPFPGCCFCAGY